MASLCTRKKKKQFLYDNLQVYRKQVVLYTGSRELLLSLQNVYDNSKHYLRRQGCI